MPTYSFHIRHPSGKEILFDLGSRKDWWNFSPLVVATIKKLIWGLDVTKGINEVLTEGGVDLNRISSIVISHWHWDHTGDPSLFPKSAELVFGPGFKKQFMPGYPTNPKGVMLDSDFEGRTVREVEFSPDFKIGEFEAHDFFGDGSFYILNVPGHAVGHISALARTTPDTFVFMGGDICHFGGSYRPTIYAPMPETIPEGVPLDRKRFRLPCPCSMFTACHPDQENARTKPYYTVTFEEGSWYIDPPTAQQSIDRLQVFDADPNVFVCIAHDEGLMDVVDWFPNGKITDWKKKGWKEQSQWGFLNTLPIDGKPAAERFCPGLMKDGKIANL
ncbi:Beta-lactamase-like protein [Neofusicoccum parvum]|uniref:Beta-lactamase-like protein n=2 Tax=Neofusicoccum parvum TaxID=310453 RepID=A0ACB5S6X0_9PEZI|nr:putative metallo-beta-lactamase superfamily protein [Neofusicoccum parvum UCRNP2]GME28479.1 Beta-lactamase-like protein [Neofusicoccum parvum]GME32716.1 Beta-lactamase-like protein [Neofusicoccum parvum]